MKQDLPTDRMRQHPDLEQLKRQAKELLRDFASGDPAATAEVHARYSKAYASTFALHDAQLVIARRYGFESWPKLKAYVDGVTIKRLSDAVSADDLAEVRAMLRVRPELVGLTMSYSDERRAIHYAVMNRSQEMVRLLMRYGANAREGIHPHRDATTAWIIAKERGYDDIVQIIEKEEQQQRRSESDAVPGTASRGDEKARASVASGDVEWLRSRHTEGNLVNSVRWDDGGLLTVAVLHSRPEMLHLLLDFGFDPDERVLSGEGDWVAYSQGYPLWHSAALGKREMAEMLLKRGANPNAHVDSSGSAVYSAYSHKQWHMVELLCRYGGVVSADTAAIYRQTELARQMLADEARGVLQEGVVSPGKLVAEELLHFGASGGDPEIVQMALDRIDWPRDDRRWVSELMEPLYFWHHIPWLYAGNREFDRSTYLACFRLILDRCDPNLIGSFGRSALHEVSAMRGHVAEEEAVAFAMALLDAGARMDVQDDLLKSTPLGWACRWGRAGVARVMLERGATPVEANAEPWAQSCEWAEKMGHSHVLTLLREYRV